MSSLDNRVEDLRDDLVTAQAMIDRARAHLKSNSCLFTSEMYEYFTRDLDEKQAHLDRQKRIVEIEFPKH